MKEKLIKVNEVYTLMDDGKMIASNDVDFQIDYEIQKLSLKNCQAIENGYNLDELTKADADLRYNQPGEEDLWLTRVTGIEYGFNLALEILGDKKFSQNDVLDVVNHVLHEMVLVEGFDKQYLFPESVYHEVTTKCKSLQKTEWDVEIVTEDEFTSNQGLDYNQFVKCRVLRIDGDDVYGEYIDGTLTNLDIPFSLSGLNDVEGNSVGKPKLDEDGCIILKRI